MNGIKRFLPLSLAFTLWCVVIPNWPGMSLSTVRRAMKQPFFSINDISVMNAFGPYREEPERSLPALQAPHVLMQKNRQPYLMDRHRAILQ